MTVIETLVEAAKRYRGEYCRDGDPSMATGAALETAIAAVEAEQSERALPITREWLRSLGSVRIPDYVYPESPGNDNERIGQLILWEFNDTGEWLVRDADWMKVTTRGQVHDLLAALGVKTGN